MLNRNIIPSMGGAQIGEDLEYFAGLSEKNTSIVEVGTWLGAGTYHLAKGINEKNVEVHCFDRFQSNIQEVNKAAGNDLILTVGQDTLPIVKEYLKEFKNIVYHKTNIYEAKWEGKKISLYVDDACKRTDKFIYAIKTFSPCWIPGKTIIILMDFFWHLKHPDEKDAQCQPEFIEKNKEFFHHIRDWNKRACSAFLYLGGYEDFDLLENENKC